LRTFKIEKEPYDEGEIIYQSDKITFNPGVTVLVGCNGCGKTTLINMIKSRLKKENIPCICYNNLVEGGKDSINNAMRRGDMSFVANGFISSEGELISLNLGEFARQIGEFIKYGKKEKSNLEDIISRLADATSDSTESDSIKTKERWVLLDAVDSGLSVDNIVDLQSLFDMILSDTVQEYEVYIVISANEYELARGQNCLDVTQGSYIAFSDYEEYREFILNSRSKKDNR